MSTVKNRSYIIVETTCESEKEVQKLSDIILNDRLGACVQVVPSVRSSYWWNDEIVTSAEFLLRVKTVDSKFEMLEKVILDNHSYETPEIISVKMEFVSNSYSNWLDKELNL